MFGLTTILTWLGNLLGGPFAKAAVDAYRAKLTATNTSEHIAADLAGRELAVEQREQELKAQINVADGMHWYSAAIRPLFALPFVIYLFKVVVWDKVYPGGSTDPLSPELLDTFKTVLSFYFVGRSVEKVAQIVTRRYALPGSAR